MKTERSDVSFPLWRKKVDASLFRYGGTAIPNWACKMWNLDQVITSSSSKDPSTHFQIILNQNEKFVGTITLSDSNEKRTPQYRLWFSDDLSFRLKDIYLMSYMRDIEQTLRGKKGEIEEEIAFWEFLDIEIDETNRIVYLTSYYTQKPSFPELFRRLVDSPTIEKIDDELNSKDDFRIYKTDWKHRSELQGEIGAKNVLYMLADTVNKLLYVGEASNLVRRLSQVHPSIKKWNYYRYNCLPDILAKHRKVFERMMIRDFASVLPNKKDIASIDLKEYTFANDKIDR